MNKEEKVEYLKKLEVLISEWFSLRKSGRDWEKMHALVIEMAKSWGVAGEILRGLEYKTDIEITDSNRGKNIKPQIGDIFHNGIFSSTHTGDQYVHMSTLHSYVLGAIEKVNKGVVVRENVLPNLNLLTSILNTFPDVVSRLKYRRKGKIALEITDEYDVQDVLYVMLKGAFSTLQYEDPTPKEGLTSTRSDFVINDLNTYIETKFVSEKGQEKTIHDECMLDIQKYGPQENCQKIVFFIYDPNKCIDNQFAFKTSLERNRTVDGKDVEVITLILN